MEGKALANANPRVWDDGTACALGESVATSHTFPKMFQAAMLLTLILCSPICARAEPLAEPTSSSASVAPAANAEEQHHGLPQSAVELGRPFGLPITNSMVLTWIVGLGLILFARRAT